MRVMRALIAAAAVFAVAAAARPVAAKGCHDTSHVVGRERCTRFGTWSRDQPGEAYWVEFGPSRHVFDAQRFSLGSGNLASVTSSSDGDLRTVALGPLDERFLFAIGRLFYGGLELDSGWLTTTPAGNGVPATNGAVMAMHAIGGAHVALGRISVGAELAAGGRVLMLNGDCGARACAGEYSTLETRAELEARTTVDFWIGPHASVGVALGRSVIDAGDTRVMVYIAGHARAFDGMH